MNSFNPFKKDLEKIVSNAFKKAFEKPLDAPWSIDKIKKEQFGDYSSNIAMIAGKRLNKPPRDIASLIINEIEPNNFIKKTEIAGPGFINFYIEDDYFKKFLEETVLNENFFHPNIGENKKVVIEYSQPNIAKPLGVHHLLSTIIGQSIVNIYQQSNFEVIKVNHIGDWGTQFGKLIYAYKTWGDRKVIEKNAISELLKLYIKFHNEAEKDKTLEDKGREEFKKLEEGDEENTKLWKWIREISLDEVKSTYKKLGGITFEEKDYIGESFYNEMTGKILDEGKKRGVFIESKGAFIAEIGDKEPPMLVQKNDGTTIYATRDLAQVKYRSTLGIVKNIMVVDVAQSLHFRQFFYTAKRLNYNKNKYGEVDLIHVVFGRMQLPDHNMSTRKGNIILLDQLLVEAKERAFKMVDQINPNLTDKEKNHISRISGIGAVKYNVLCQNRIHNITFEWDRMITLEGNSAPYLQYTHARGCSILNKGTKGKDIRLSHKQEYKLIKIIASFPEVLLESQENNMPHHIATFAYELSTEFNSFYNSCPILKEKEEIKNLRLLITELTVKTLKICLNLLVIEAPEKM